MFDKNKLLSGQDAQQVSRDPESLENVMSQGLSKIQVVNELADRIMQKIAPTPEKNGVSSPSAPGLYGIAQYTNELGYQAQIKLEKILISLGG